MTKGIWIFLLITVAVIAFAVGYKTAPSECLTCGGKELKKTSEVKSQNISDKK